MKRFRIAIVTLLLCTLVIPLSAEDKIFDIFLPSGNVRTEPDLSPVPYQVCLTLIQAEPKETTRIERISDLLDLLKGTHQKQIQDTCIENLKTLSRRIPTIYNKILLSKGILDAGHKREGHDMLVQLERHISIQAPEFQLLYIKALIEADEAKKAEERLGEFIGQTRPEDQLYDAAILYCTLQKPDKAIDLCKKITPFKSDLDELEYRRLKPKLLAKIANTLLADKRKSEAEELIKQAEKLATNPENPFSKTGYLDLVDYWVSQNDIAKARAYVDGLKSANQKSRGYVIIGKQIALSDREQAKELYELAYATALKAEEGTWYINSDKANTFFKTSDLADKLGRSDTAIELRTKAFNFVSKMKKGQIVPLMDMAKFYKTTPISKEEEKLFLKF